MVKVVNTYKAAAAEIVEVLHKNKIPLALIPTVYESVDQLIKMNTIPCGPEIKPEPTTVLSSSEGDTISFAGTGAHRHSYPVAQSFSSSDFGRHTHSIKTDWRPDPELYRVKDKDNGISSNTVNEPLKSSS